jgi:hypothetical protein
MFSALSQATGGLSAGELVGDAEFVEQRLGLEIGDPDRRDLAVSDGPNIDDFDY